MQNASGILVFGGILVCWCVNVYSMTEIDVDVVLNALVSCDLIHKVCVGL